MARGRLFVGTSGYEYAHWRGVFYPNELPKKSWFEHYAETFDTVEINNTFYRLPAPEVFDRWRERAPRRFTYAVKLSRFATHVKRLKDPEEPLSRFLGGAKRLGPHLGPILVQLPPNMRPDFARLEAFFEALDPGVLWTLEVRRAEWLSRALYALLEEHGVALCVHDMLEDHPRLVTATFTYLRFHGDGYKGSYTPQRLAAEARRVSSQLDEGVDVYAYFNNDAEGWAVANARDLRRYLGR